MASRFLLVASLVWLGAIFIAPFGVELPYLVGSFICHQRPERSFWIAGSPMPVCARCTGLYASASVGALVPVVRAGLRGGTLRASTVRALLMIAAVPTVATLIVEWLGLAQPSSVVRFMAALPLGAVTGWIVTSVLDGER